jgi:hypothetical protein
MKVGLVMPFGIAYVIRIQVMMMEMPEFPVFWLLMSATGLLMTND